MTEQDDLLADQKSLEVMFNDLSFMTTEANIKVFALTDLTVRLDLLESYWESFSSNAMVLNRYSVELKDRTFFKEKKYSTVMNLYLKSKAAFRARIEQLSLMARGASTSNTGTQAQPSPQQRSVQAALEKLKLPEFDGNPHRWEDFKETFEALVIRDTSIDDIVKLQRLYNCLTGEAAKRLISTRGLNFQNAWEALCRRYDNKCLRFSLQMQSLVDLPAANKESATHLNLLLNTVNESICTFKNLKHPVDRWDSVLNFFIESKMAASTRLDWGKVVEQRHATFDELKTFIEDRIRTLDIVGTGAEWQDEPSTESSGKNNNKSSSRKPKSAALHAATKDSADTSDNTKCSFCGSNHFIAFCKKISASSQEARRQHVISARLCFNCLNPSHTVESCASKGRCQVCQGKHHTKLHRDSSSGTSTSCKLANTDDTESVISERVDGNGATEAATYTAAAAAAGRNVLLATTHVILESPSGQRVSVRALLDSGAEESFITEHVAQLLELKKSSADVVVSGVGGSAVVVAKNRAKIVLKSAHKTDYSFEVSALILKRLSTVVPRCEVKRQTWAHLAGLCLADPHYGVPARIDCILSSEVYASALQAGVKQGPPGTPTALHTVFGWVLMGATSTCNKSKPNGATAFHITVDQEITKAVSRLWEIQEVPTTTILIPEDETCLQHFKCTHTRNASGLFVVRLPFIKHPPPVDTRRAAEACFMRLERRFAKQPELAKQYQDFMIEYRELGHMERVPRSEHVIDCSSHFPHHPVFKKDNSKKIRVVFNASQKNENGESFNSYLHVGPKLQEDILVLIIRWSFVSVAFTCDVVKMFRQFLIHKDDADWQRILWRDSVEEEIDVYRLLTVTYGTACAPFMANACMNQLAEDGRDKWPRGSDVLEKARYADDFLAGGDTLEEAVVVGHQLIEILQSAGMSVGKWASNSPELLRQLGLLELSSESTDLQEPEAVSTLGLRWIAEEDSFAFKISRQDTMKKATKRSILSETAKLFDPIGWLEPVIVRAKVLLQDLWLQGVDWDTPVSPTMNNKWQELHAQLGDLEAIRIPRWFGATKSIKWELHGFSDASERAYAATVYIVVPTANGFAARLVAAKSKVAPTKVISLPKLELCGASLLTHLIDYLVNKLDNKPSQMHCWTDSKVVLAWLKSHPSRWKTFIANRVSEIASTLPTAVWRHVKSADNPADLATRGLTPLQLKDSRIWWEGPEWIGRKQDDWPSSNEDLTTNEEIRKTVGSNAFHVQITNEWTDWLGKFSSIDKIIRILAYVQRWRANSALKNEDRRRNWLSALEIASGISK